jgi:hypothetical protein
MATPRNPILDHTLDDDLPNIREYCELFKKLPLNIREGLKIYVFEDKSIDYYYGCYVAYYQAFVIADMAKNETIAESLQWLVWAISAKIISVLNKSKKEILNAKSIHDVKNI